MKLFPTQRGKLLVVHIHPFEPFYFRCGQFNTFIVVACCYVEIFGLSTNSFRKVTGTHNRSREFRMARKNVPYRIYRFLLLGATMFRRYLCTESSHYVQFLPNCRHGKLVISSTCIGTKSLGAAFPLKLAFSAQTKSFFYLPNYLFSGSANQKT